MATTLEDLARRMELLEAEVARLRKRVEGPFIEETPAEHGARMLREAKAEQGALKATMDQLFEQMGIKGEAPGIEKLRAMQREHERQQAERKKQRASAKTGPAQRKAAGKRAR